MTICTANGSTLKQKGKNDTKGFISTGYDWAKKERVPDEERVYTNLFHIVQRMKRESAGEVQAKSSSPKVFTTSSNEIRLQQFFIQL